MPESDHRESAHSRAPIRSSFTKGRLSLFAGLILVGVAGTALQACGPSETVNAAGTPQPATSPDRTPAPRSPEPPTVTAQVVPTLDRTKLRTPEATLTKASKATTARALATQQAGPTSSGSSPKPSPSITR